MVPDVIGVVGAGAMGSGIAQVAVVAGDRVRLFDAAPGAAERAVAAIRDRIKALVARGRLTVDPDAVDLSAVSLDGLSGCSAVVEAIVEDLDAKRALFAALEAVVTPNCLLASNSSSFSPTAIAAGLNHPSRVVGLHFFNPVPAMKLAEVISGLGTAVPAADVAAGLAERWGKTVVRSAATPGFIVNRIARPFYAEAWRLRAERSAAPEVIDAVLTGAGGFRMGPFALMDLIGHDVNEAVTRSVWAAFGHDPRFEPSLAQRALVEAGWLGRKSGRGVYAYDSGAAVTEAAPSPATPPPAAVTDQGGTPLRPLLERSPVPLTPGTKATGHAELPSGGLLVQCDGTTATALSAVCGRPVVVVDRVLDPAEATAVAIAVSDGCPPPVLAEATGLLQSAGVSVHVIGDTPGLIVTRVVAMLANLAADAAASDVATAADIDTAMRLGVNYPLGPAAWGRAWGAATLVAILDNLQDCYRDGRYRACLALRRTAWSGQPL